MRNLTRTILTCGAAAWVWACVAGTAVANSSDFVTLDFIGDSPARLGYLTYDHRTMLVAVGQSNFYVHNEAGSYGGLGKTVVNDSPQSMTTGYCIDVYQAIREDHTYTFDVVDLASAPTLVNHGRADDLKRLFKKYQDDVVDASTAAAFEAAVWEIVNETATKRERVDGKWVRVPDFDVTGGTFRVTPATGGRWDRIANGWLKNLGTDSMDAYALVSTTAQDFAWIVPLAGGTATPVPEPMTMATAFLSLSAMGVYLRKRMRAARI